MQLMLLGRWIPMLVLLVGYVPWTGAVNASVAGQWCQAYRSGEQKSLSMAFDTPHLVEHVNEDLNTSVRYADITTWFEKNRISLKDQSEETFLTFCSELYTHMLELNGTVATDGYGIFNVKPKVWMASLISIVVISAVGLLGVGVVPLVQKVFYNQVIQYLVALAVGTLTGDAMLHLIPHAIVVGGGHSHEAPSEDGGISDERMAVYRGLVALGGVYFFFLAEKTLGFVTEYRTEKKLEKEDQQRALLHPRRSTEVRRLSTFRPSIIPGSLSVPGQQIRRLSLMDPSCRRTSRAMSIVNEDILTTGLTNKAMRSIDILNRYAAEDAQADEQLSDIESADEDGRLTGSKSSSDRLDDASSKAPTVTTSTLSVPRVVVVMDASEDADGNELHPKTPESKSTEQETAEKKELKKHGHGHSHEVPGSVASVAWMVILGDGLHNFTDGMAIGAAFAQSISGGLSTAVAVFCHELPHELGDFAVLLKTGMRIKDALFFNVVSSILSLIGMLVGISLGNVADASYWIFAVTAGTFIYIALVDMLPELNNAELRPGQTRVGQLFIQSVGLFTGVGIMLCIALFEDKIKVMVD